MSYEFVNFAESYGLQVKQFSRDRIVRCPTNDKPRSDNGRFFFDGKRGWVCDMALGGELHWWNDPNSNPYTEQEKREWAAKHRKAQHDRQNEQQRVAQEAEDILKRAYAETHPYLADKGFPKQIGLVSKEGALLIPMRDCLRHNVIGVQTIRLVDNDWQKKMLKGQRAKGAVHVFGSKSAAETILVEGYATGLSVKAAVSQLNLNASVTVCFSDNNLVAVAALITVRKIIYADNDVSNAGEQAAIKTGCRYVMSDTKGHDANDDHVKMGLIHVCKKIVEMRSH